MGDQHSMYNQNSGRETWIGQGLPQPTVEGKDDNPAEKDLTINADAMQNSSTKKGRTARNRKRRQAKQVKEGMAMFDTPNEVDKILSEAQTEVDAQEADTKRYNTGNPKAADMYKAFGFEDKKKDQADNIKEDSDNCPWCQKDPEGSGKPKWWRERANNWQKMLGSDNKRLGEWLSDHTFGTENRMQDTHDSDTEMHHTQSKQIPKEIEGAKEGMSAQAGANYDTMSAMGFPPTKEQSAEYEKRRNNSTKTHKSPNQSQNAKDHKCIGCGKQADTFALFGRRDRKTDTRNYLTDRESGKQVALPVCNSCGKELSAAAGERGVDIIPDPEGGHSKETQEELKSLESIIDKAEESNFGAGQRGLGYGNEGYTVVQGSGQNHTISEIPPEMEIIVHDINEIKESKKEGYTTEAGNSKRGDPSRATDDDDSLLSQTFVKNDPNWRSVNETVPKPKKDTPNPLDEDDDSLLAFPKEDSLDDGEVAPNM